MNRSWMGDRKRETKGSKKKQKKTEGFMRLINKEDREAEKQNKDGDETATRREGQGDSY